MAENGCPPKVWKLICAHRDDKAEETEHLATLVKERRKLETELAGCPAPDREQKLRDLGENFLFIKASRARIASLEDRIDTAIAEANDPRLFDDAPEPLGPIRTTGQLFGWLKAAEKSKAEQDKRDEYDEDLLKLDVSEMAIDERIIACLNKHKVKKMKHVFEIIDDPNDDFTNYDGIGSVGAMAIEKAAKALKKKWAKAEKPVGEPEQAGELAPVGE